MSERESNRPSPLTFGHSRRPQKKDREEAFRESAGFRQTWRIESCLLRAILLCLSTPRPLFPVHPKLTSASAST